MRHFCLHVATLSETLKVIVEHTGMTNQTHPFLACFGIIANEGAAPTTQNLIISAPGNQVNFLVGNVLTQNRPSYRLANEYLPIS